MALAKDLTPGATLSLSAAGDTVPAFGPLSVVVPSAISLTAPVIPVGIEFELDTKADVQVGWTNGQNGASMIFEGTTPGGYFKCEWDATAGSGSVPASLLTSFAGTSGSVDYGQITTTTSAASGYTVELRAVVYGSDPVIYK
jgi:hypothetical protein